MKDIKLTLYDWLGYLIPGTILIVSIYLVIKDTKVFNDSYFKIDSGFINGFLFFCLAYLIGHIVHSIANFTIDLLPYGDYAPQKYFNNNLSQDFNSSQIQIINDILKKKFGIQIGDNKEEELKNNYWLCYTYVIENKPDSLSQTYLNLNGFYRGSSVSTLMASLIFFIKSILACNCALFLFLGSILLIFSVLLYLRARRFKIFLTRTVYLDFLSLNKKDNDKT